MNGSIPTSLMQAGRCKRQGTSSQSTTRNARRKATAWHSSTSTSWPSSISKNARRKKGGYHICWRPTYHKWGRGKGQRQQWSGDDYWMHHYQSRGRGGKGKDDIKVDGNIVDNGKTIYFHWREHMRAGRSWGFTQCIRSCVVCRSASRILFQDLLGMFQHFETDKYYTCMKRKRMW